MTRNSTPLYEPDPFNVQYFGSVEAAIIDDIDAIEAYMKRWKDELSLEEYEELKEMKQQAIRMKFNMVSNSDR